MGAEVAWKRWAARPHPIGRWAAVLLLGVALVAIGSVGGAARLWLVYHRPELVGAARNTDAGPDPTALAAAVALLLSGVGLAAVLVFARRCPVPSRRIAAGIVAVGLTMTVGVIAADADPGPRCSEDHYSGSLRCATGGEARASDVRTVLVPGLLTVACLVAGERIERRRTARAEHGRERH